jgi:hypothetical protein
MDASTRSWGLLETDTYDDHCEGRLAAIVFVSPVHSDG